MSLSTTSPERDRTRDLNNGKNGGSNDTSYTASPLQSPSGVRKRVRPKCLIPSPDFLQPGAISAIDLFGEGSDDCCTARKMHSASQNNMFNIEEYEKSFAEDRTEWPLVCGTKFSINDFTANMPNTDSRQDPPFETGISNGDCLLACFSLALEALNNGIISWVEKVDAASDMRKIVIAWIRKNWKEHPVFNQSMLVHEIITTEHDLFEERREDDLVGWGTTPEEQLEAYSRRCKALYFSDVEMMLFSSMMFEKGIHIMFRTWRSDPSTNRRNLVVVTPEREYFQMHGITETYVIDLEHSGIVDGASAHYKLLEGGSLRGLLETDKEERKRAQANELKEEREEGGKRIKKSE